MATYPATNETEATELLISASNQVHDIVNGGALATVTTDSGEIPSVRKALADTFLFLDPLPWDQGVSESAFNRLRMFNANLYWAPSATTVQPVIMGATPEGDPNWFLAPVTNTKYNDLPVKIPVVPYGQGTIVISPVTSQEYPLNQGVVYSVDGNEVIYRFAGTEADLPYDLSQPFDESKWVDANMVRRHLVYSTGYEGGKKITITNGQTEFGPFYDAGELVTISSTQCVLNGSMISPNNISLSIDRTIITLDIQGLDEDSNLDIYLNSIVSQPPEDRTSFTIFDVGDYGILGSPSGDSSTFNACMDAVRSFIAGTALTPSNNGVLVRFSRDSIINQPIDFTNIRAGWTVVIDGNGATLDVRTTGGVGVDCLGSRRVLYRNFTIWADEVYNVKSGMQIGRRKTGQVADENHLDNIHIIGSYRRAALFSMASELNLHTHCTYLNDNPNFDDSYALICDSFNVFNTTSVHTDTSELFVNTGNSHNNNTYIACKFTRRRDGQGNGYCMYWDNNMHGHRWIGCYMIASGEAGIKYVVRDDIHNKPALNMEFVGHLEKNPTSDFLGYFMRLESFTGTLLNHEILGLKLTDHNLFPNQAILHGIGGTRWKIYGDFDFPETTTNDGTTGKYATFYNPSADFQFVGTARLTSKLNPVVFNNSSDVDLTIVGSTFYNDHSPATYMTRKSSGSSITIKDSSAGKLISPALRGITDTLLPSGCLGVEGGPTENKTVKVKL